MIREMSGVDAVKDKANAKVYLNWLNKLQDTLDENYGCQEQAKSNPQDAREAPSAKDGSSAKRDRLRALGSYAKKQQKKKVFLQQLWKKLAAVVVAAHQWLSQYNIKETFVHNRVKQIRELCSDEDITIRYVPSPTFLMKEEEWPANENFKLFPEGEEQKLSLFKIEGVIKCRGRLGNLQDSQIQNDPILVNGGHPFVRGFIGYLHRHFNCSSKRYTLNKAVPVSTPLACQFLSTVFAPSRVSSVIQNAMSSARSIFLWIGHISPIFHSSGGGHMATCCGCVCTLFGASPQSNKCAGGMSESRGWVGSRSLVVNPCPLTHLYWYRFPNNPERKEEWLKNLRVQNFTPGKWSLLCSDHFLEKYMDRTGQIIRLRNNAVPTRFKAFPKYLKKISKDCLSPKKILPEISDANEDLSENIEVQTPNISQQTTKVCLPLKKRILPEVSAPSEDLTANLEAPYPKTICHDHDYTPSPSNLKKKLDKSKKHIDSLKIKLKATQQRERRLKNRVNSLKKIIKELKQQHQISSHEKTSKKGKLFSHNEINNINSEKLSDVEEVDSSIFSIQEENQPNKSLDKSETSTESSNRNSVLKISSVFSLAQEATLEENLTDSESENSGKISKPKVHHLYGSDKNKVKNHEEVAIGDDANVNEDENDSEETDDDEMPNVIIVRRW
ncbi:unnamed protein product, partial [Meganyctiphanes norvegica]